MSAAVTCTQPECEAPAGGACATGHVDPQHCPNAVVTGEDEAGTTPPSSIEAGDELVIPAEPPGQPLEGGEAMSLAEADTVIARGLARLIAPAGPVSVGKTTLLVELYQRFMRGAWGGWAFAGSQTLLAFERLAFPSRFHERLVLPETWRTRISEDGRLVLHLALGGQGAARRPTQLLLADESGEVFNRIVDGADPVELVPAFRLADKVPILVDGEQFAEAGLRHRSVSRTQQLLAVLLERDALPPNADIALVLTKWDVVRAGGEATLEAWENDAQGLIDRFSTPAHPIGKMRVAARPLHLLPEGEDGMAALLAWLTETPAPAPVTPETTALPGNRSFERFNRGTP